MKRALDSLNALARAEDLARAELSRMQSRRRCPSCGGPRRKRRRHPLEKYVCHTCVGRVPEDKVRLAANAWGPFQLEHLRLFFELLAAALGKVDSSNGRGPTAAA